MFWLFLPTLAAAGFFSEHYEKYLNVAVDPCDDFYDHVCTTAMTEDRFFFPDLTERFQNYTQQVSSPKIREFRTLIVDNYNNFPAVEMEEEDMQAVENFLKDLEVTSNLTFHQCSKYNFFFNDVIFLEGLEAYDAQYRMQSTPYVKTVKKKMMDIFTLLKSSLMEEFSEAPWTMKYPELIHFLKTVTLVEVELTKDLQLEQYAEELMQRYQNCLGVTTNLTQELAGVCMGYAICPIKVTLDKEIGDYYKDTFMKGPFYNDENNTISLTPQFYMFEEEDLPFMLGSLDFLISHEIGHVFFRPGGAIPSNSECFRKHMQNSCNTFVDDEEECGKYDQIVDDVNGNYSRLGDDAADWVGMHSGLKALKNYYPKIFAGINPKSIELTKQFFYANAIIWCTEDAKHGDTAHSPVKLRTNGIASLFPEFSEAFQCKRGSRMAKAATCLPFAGAGAPTHKRINTNE